MEKEKRNFETLKSKLDQLTSSKSPEEIKSHLAELRRFGQELDADEIKALLACSCGPHHEDGIQPW